MSESSADIVKYLNIIEGKNNQDINISNNEIFLGIPTEGAEINKTYIFENGLRWLKIIDEQEDLWLVETGLIEYDNDSVEYISKHDLSTMIKNGTMILKEEIKTNLTESKFSPSDNLEFDIFMESVNRYLLLNYNKESNELNYPWKIAWAENKLPFEAAEEAIMEDIENDS